MADEPTTPAEAAPETPVEKKLDEVAETAEKKAEKEADKKPITLEDLYECMKGLEARFDYFAELVLDSEHIEDDGAVIAVVTPEPEPEKKQEPEPEKKPETETRPPAKEPEAERTRRHKLV